MLAVCELTHKTMGQNGGGEWVPVGVVGRDGRTWPMEEALRLRYAGEVVFLYRGEKLNNLMLLPAQREPLGNGSERGSAQHFQATQVLQHHF